MVGPRGTWTGGSSACQAEPSGTPTSVTKHHPLEECSGAEPAARLPCQAERERDQEPRGKFALRRRKHSSAPICCKRAGQAWQPQQVVLGKAPPAPGNAGRADQRPQRPDFALSFSRSAGALTFTMNAWAGGWGCVWGGGGGTLIDSGGSTGAEKCNSLNQAGNQPPAAHHVPPTLSAPPSHPAPRQQT